MKIRAANRADLNEIKELTLPWFSESGYKLTPSLDAVERLFLSNLSDDEVIMLVAEHDDKIIAFGVVSIRQIVFKEPQAQIEWFFVLTEYRGTGVGILMAEALRDLSLKKGAAIIIADTHFAKHARVFANMFKKLGFKQTGYVLTWVKS